MFSIKIHSLALIVILTVILFLAQQAIPQSYPQKHYTVDEGLPQSIVTNIMKDSRGFIWLATNDGVSRFDGLNFKNYKPSNGYPFHLVTGIVEKEPGIFWIADYAGSLYELKNDHVKKIELLKNLPAYHINFLKKGKNNEILMGIEPGGLVIVKKDSVIKCFDIPGFENEPVITAVNGFDGSHWVGTYNKGAYQLKDGKKVFAITKEQGLPDNEVRVIMPLKNGEVWFGTHKGLYILGNKKISDNFNDRYSENFISHLYLENENSIWLSVSKGKGGFFHFKNGSVSEVIKRDRGFLPRSVYFDDMGIMYVNTNNGFYVIPDRNFKNFGREAGFADSYIKAITKDDRGRLWIATKGAGLYRLKNEELEHFENRDYNYSDKTITCLKFIKDKLWVGTRKGLFFIRDEQVFENSLSSYLGEQEIRQIYPYDKKNTMVLTKKSIHKVSGDTITDLTYNLNGKNVSLWGLAFDKNGALFLATNGNGLWTLQDTIWNHFTLSVKVGLKNIYGIRRDKDANLYFPSISGAFIWDGRELRQIFKDYETVWDVLPVDSTEIWFGTNHGLFCKRDGQTFLYNRKSGFVSTEYNIGSFFKENDTSFWFGGVTGLLHYNKKSDSFKQSGELFITSLQFRDSVICFPPAEGLVFNPGNKNYRFQFTYVDVIDAGNIEFRYFLEGFDRDTLNAGTRNFANYTNLADGNYTFHVLARKKFEKTDLAARKIIFTILKPWWKTWWVYLGYFAIASLFIYFLIHLRLRALQNRNLMLERSILERTNDLRWSNKMLIKEVKERKKAEEDVEKEKEQLAVTLGSITDGVIRTDKDGIILLMNEIAERLCGMNVREAVGKDFSDICILLDEKSKEQITLTPAKIISEHKLAVKPYVVYFQHKQTGRQVLASLNGSPIYGREKTLIGYVFVFRDITREREMEEEFHKAQKLESIGLLAGGIAHDFNNILSGILGNAQLAELSHLKGNDIQKYFDGIIEAAKKATNLTQQLLTFSKGGAPVKKNISLKQILPETAEFALRGSNVTSNININQDLWIIYADPGQANQVINNLVINADQAMPSGGVIEINAENVCVEQDQDIPGLIKGMYVKIEIVDQGIGISEENLAKIFDPYFTTKQKGSGLGLASTYSIIEKHNGLISVKSKIDKGTMFTVYLPAIPEQAKEAEEQEKIIQPGKGKILVMDDEEYIREIVKDMLVLLGYKVQLAKDGKEALSIYKQAFREESPFDLVIMDLTIPGGMGGKEAVRKLLKIDPNAKVVVASGYSTDSVLADYEEFGFKAILNKPFSIEELSAIIPKLIF